VGGGVVIHDVNHAGKFFGIGLPNGSSLRTSS
jgi:hypothetical protein